MDPQTHSSVLAEPIEMRPMRRNDIEAVMSIERACFPNAWRRRDFISCLPRSGNQAWIAERGGQIVGFVVYKTEPTALHLANLAVDPHYRRRRIGAELVHHALRQAADIHLDEVCLEVRESNLDAQLFYRSLGFKAVAIKRAYYRDTGEDAYVMEYHAQRDAESGVAN